MICSSKVSKYWQPGDLWHVMNNRRTGRISDEVYTFDSGQVFGPDHAIAMCTLGSVVAWVHKADTGSYLVCTDEPETLQLMVDEGRVEFFIEEQR